MKLATLLFADDDLDILRTAEIMFGDRHRVLTASSIAKAKIILEKESVDVVIVDLNFEGQVETGLHLMDHILRENSRAAVIVLSNDANTRRVSDSMRRPIVDFVAKSDDYEGLLKIAIERALGRASPPVASTFRYQTNSPKMKQAIDRIDRATRSPTSMPILLLGESGVGKDLLCRHIASHLNKKIVSLNLATLSQELAASTLFGHVRGAFTGAANHQIGLFEQANNGILFLDEIGECTLDIQAKLLRAIETKEIQSVGSAVTKKVNVRFVAATNRDLSEMVQRGTFRLDLFERLNAFTFQIPSLRNRPEDISYYANQYLEELSDGAIYQFTPCGLKALLDYHWPGNIRELRNVMERVFVFSDARVFDRETVEMAIGRASSTSDEIKDVLGKSDYLRALEANAGNRAHAAKTLGVSRATFFRNLKTWGIGDQVKSEVGRPKRSNGA